MTIRKRLRVTTRSIGSIPGCTMLPSGNQPELYSGPLPTFETLAFIKRMEADHEEWQRKRADIKGKGWRYNPVTGMAEPKPVRAKIAA